MEKIKEVSDAMVVLNIFYIIIINIGYIAIPMPNKIYLRDLEIVPPYNITFGDILYILIPLNLILYLIYRILRKNGKRSTKET